MKLSTCFCILSLDKSFLWKLVRCRWGSYEERFMSTYTQGTFLIPPYFNSPKSIYAFVPFSRKRLKIHKLLIHMNRNILNLSSPAATYDEPEWEAVLWLETIAALPALTLCIMMVVYLIGFGFWRRMGALNMAMVLFAVITCKYGCSPHDHGGVRCSRASARRAKFDHVAVRCSHM